MSKENADILLREAQKAGITDRRELAIFMGQMQHESGNFNRMTEGLNYSPERLLQVFGPYTDRKGVWHDGRNGLTTIEEARAITARGQEGIANAMYGGVWGAKNLGNTEEGDGWKYRGRGFTQLTGRDGYETMGKKLGLDLVNNPDLASDPQIAAKIAVQYWKDRVVSKGHQLDVEAATRDINGGTNGLAERRTAANEWGRKFEQGYLEQIGTVQPSPGGRGQSPGGSGQSTKPADSMADGVLERGEKGSAVKAMQEQLIKAGITQVNGRPFTADSDFGAQTEAAVREYQRSRGLEVDGKAGPQTLGALKNNTSAKVEGTPDQTQPGTGTSARTGPQSFNDVMRVMLPPQNGTAPHITSDFGPRKLNGKDDDHGGVDFNYVGGQSGVNLRHPTVRSPVSGEVVFSGGQYGTVKIRDDQGNLHEILHMNSRSVQVTNPPTRVEAGDPIGTMGGRGPNGAGQYAQHVHYQMRDANNKLIDPEAYWNNPQRQQGKDAPVATKTELKHGDKGAQVEQLQTRLNDLGYTDAAGKKLKPDADYGDRTKQAVEQFQRENGLKVTGVADKETMGLVEKGMTRYAAADGVLKPGEKGPDVRGLQTNLAEMGFKGTDGKPLKVDGDYGANTQAAVSAFQKANGLPETGVADKATLEKVGDKSKVEAKVDAEARITGVVDGVAKATPQINDPKHPDNKLYQQALSNLEQMGPNGGFKSREELERAAGALAADAKLSGLTQIDHVTRSKNGEGLIAIQGADPWASDVKRANLDANQAVNQSMEQSTKMAEAQTSNPAKVEDQRPRVVTMQ